MVIEFNNLIFFGLIFSYLSIQGIIYYIKQETINFKTELINLCLFISFLFVVSLTMFPIRFGYKFEGFEIFNIIPFRIILKLYREYSFTYFLYNVLGNIVLFVPFGLFIFIKSNMNLKKSILFTLLFTLSIEIIQGFIPYRFCEIDDIILNTLGGYIGCIIGSKIHKKGYIEASN